MARHLVKAYSGMDVLTGVFRAFLHSALPMLEEYTNQATTTQFHLLSRILSFKHLSFWGWTVRATEVVIKYIKLAGK
jgi:hypothetical protein